MNKYPQRSNGTMSQSPEGVSWRVDTCVTFEPFVCGELVEPPKADTQKLGGFLGLRIKPEMGNNVLHSERTVYS